MKTLPRQEVGFSMHCGKPNDDSKISLPAVVPIMEKFMCTSSRQIPVQVLQGTQKSLSILRNNSKSFVNVHSRLKLSNLSMTELYTTLTMLHWRKVLKKVTIIFYVFCACSTKTLNWRCHCKLNGEDNVDSVNLL